MYPDWKILDYYVLHTLQNVMNSDALESTRVMSQYVDSPTAISRLFDNIAYAKCKCLYVNFTRSAYAKRKPFLYWYFLAGAVIRMFQHALTEATFRKALTYYLTAR